MIAIVLVVILAIFLIGTYNGLVSKRNQVQNAFAGVDVQLKKRYDLIPNLVESVKGYMKHEETVLARLVELRSTPYAQLTDAQKNELDNGVQKVMSGLRVTVEQYPDLKASENVMHLQRTLNETEEQISAARRSYNAAVLEYNNAMQTFPTNLIAGLLGFQAKEFFEARQEERENVQVKF
ncbi:MAG: LemA family protein [Bacteroidales bacterium]|nr:LemA family protein [Bacteroidales bacterium]